VDRSGVCTQKTFIGVCYRPPTNQQDKRDWFLDNLHASILSVKDLHAESVLLLGDFNDRCENWEGSYDSSKLKYSLYDMINSIDLFQLIDEPTYFTAHSASLLDLIITDSPGYITTSGTLPPVGLSHHSVTY
jgi:hypothetical protein